MMSLFVASVRSLRDSSFDGRNNRRNGVRVQCRDLEGLERCCQDDDRKEDEEDLGELHFDILMFAGRNWPTVCAKRTEGTNAENKMFRLMGRIRVADQITRQLCS